MNDWISLPESGERDIRTITTEIKTLTKQAQKLILNYAIEVGRRLCEVKSMLPHGQWGEYLRSEVEFSQSTANNFMKIFEEYGADQMTLDGAVAKSQTLGNLSYSKALKLLAVPAEEREEFVQKNHVEQMSTRELEQAIRDRDAARDEVRSLRKDLDTAMQAAEEAEGGLRRENEQMRKQLDAVQENQRQQVESLHKQLAAAQKAQAQAEKEAENARKALKAAPKISTQELDKLKSDAMSEAKKELLARSEEDDRQHKKLQEAAKLAQQKAEQAAAEAERLRKQLALASAEMTEFKLHFEALQEGFNKLHGSFLKIEAQDAAQAEKLKKAMLAVVESFRKRLEG